jgi:hypothetical protein
VDGLVELAGTDVLGGGVLVPGELDVAGRVAVLRHGLPAARRRGRRLADWTRSGKGNALAWLGLAWLGRVRIWSAHF